MDRLPGALEKYVEEAAQAVFDSFVGGTNDPTLLELSVAIAERQSRAAILAFLNAAEKDGWVMVPAVATPDMIEAADNQFWQRPQQFHDVNPDRIHAAYRAMVNAAKEERS